MKQETWNGRNKIKTFCDALFDVMPDTPENVKQEEEMENRKENLPWNNARAATDIISFRVNTQQASASRRW